MILLCEQNLGWSFFFVKFYYVTISVGRITHLFGRSVRLSVSAMQISE